MVIQSERAFVDFLGSEGCEPYAGDFNCPCNLFCACWALRQGSERLGQSFYSRAIVLIAQSSASPERNRFGRCFHSSKGGSWLSVTRHHDQRREPLVGARSAWELKRGSATISAQVGVSQLECLGCGELWSHDKVERAAYSSWVVKSYRWV